MTVSWIENPQYFVVIFTCPLNQSNVNPLLKAQKMDLLLQREMQPLRVADRLAQFVDTWKMLTNDPWVLQAVKGFKLHFVSLPYSVRT